MLKNPISCRAYANTPKYDAPDTDALFTNLVPGQTYPVAYYIAIPINAAEIIGSSVILYAHGNGETRRGIREKCSMLADHYNAVVVFFDSPVSYANECFVTLDDGKTRVNLQCNELIPDGNTGYGAIEAVYASVFAFLKPCSVVVWGRSLGSSFAAYLADRHEVQGVVLESPIASMIVFVRTTMLPPVLNDLLPDIHTMFGSAVDDYTTVVFAANHAFYQAPVYIMYGTRDATLPPIHTELITRALVSRANVPVVHPLSGKDHNSAVTMEEYRAAVPMNLVHPGATGAPTQVCVHNTEEQ